MAIVPVEEGEDYRGMPGGSALMDLDGEPGGSQGRRAGLAGWLPVVHPYALSWGAAPKKQQRWMVTASWIEAVRKEHAELRQRVEVETKRSALLDQVQAEREWMEAALVRALETKRALELQLKIASLDAMGARSSSSSSSMQRGAPA
eukprot:jgi/Mesen1/6339/ME000328S05619